jgi:hypothetical protein
MDTIGSFICSARNFMDQGFRSLPTILGGFTLIVGLIQGNFNFLFFFVGLFILAPLAALIVNGLTELLFTSLPESISIPQELWLIPNGAAVQCSMFPMSVGGGIPGAANSVPSYWFTMMAFFFSYLFVNAYSLYNKQSNSKAPQEAVSARKSQATISMVMIVALGIITTILRYAKTGCETGLGVLISILLGTGLGVGWYKFMRSCGLGRLDDLFGISNRLLPMQSYEDVAPVACVPVAK